jgi:hypothetical protein
MLRRVDPDVNAAAAAKVVCGRKNVRIAVTETALTVCVVYGLTLGRTEGALRSVAGLLQLDNEIPDRATSSRRFPSLRTHVPTTNVSIEIGHQRRL